jgi:serine/threonine protein kinase
MQELQFNQLISDIPGTMWEKSLPIGKFLNVEILQRITRPFSFVARCRIRGDRDSRVVFIKRYRNSRNKPPEVFRQKVEKEFQVAKYWYDKFGDSQNFRVVKPVFVIPEKYISVTEESHGKDLFQLVLDEARFVLPKNKLAQLSRYMYNTGAWLRYKQSILSEKDERYSIDDLTEYMDVRLKILIDDKRRRFPGDYREKVLNYLQDKKTQIGEAERLVTISHSDFNPSNILVDGDVVTVLDFGRLVKESYLLDVSKLYFQLSLLTFKPQYRTAVIRKLQQALLDGFGEPKCNQLLLFRFLTIRNTLTHLSGITQFWRQRALEKIYNHWVMHKELAILDSLIQDRLL